MLPELLMQRPSSLTGKLGQRWARWAVTADREMLVEVLETVLSRSEEVERTSQTGEQHFSMSRRNLTSSLSWPCFILYRSEPETGSSSMNACKYRREYLYI